MSFSQRLRVAFDSPWLSPLHHTIRCNRRRPKPRPPLRTADTQTSESLPCYGEMSPVDRRLRSCSGIALACLEASSAIMFPTNRHVACDRATHFLEWLRHPRLGRQRERDRDSPPVRLRVAVRWTWRTLFWLCRSWLICHLFSWIGFVVPHRLPRSVSHYFSCLAR